MKLIRFNINRKTSLSVIFLSAVVISVIWSSHFLPFSNDDNFISYRYSERLLHGEGLNWNDGERVEGYSNFLWVVLIAAGGLIQHNLIIVGCVLCILSNIATMASFVRAFYKSENDRILPVITGLTILALSSSFAYWGADGLETAFFDALLAWSLAALHVLSTRDLGMKWPGIPLGLLAITRPDGILFGVGIAISIFLRDGWNREAFRAAARVAILPISFLLLQTVFRLTYYHSLVPNTAHAKIAFSENMLLLGTKYVLTGALLNGVAVIALITSLILSSYSLRRSLNQACVFLVPAFIWLCYVAYIGGDYMPYYRHWMPSLICVTYATCVLLEKSIFVWKIMPGYAVLASLILGLLIRQNVNAWDFPILIPQEFKKAVDEFHKTFPDYANNPFAELKRDESDCLVIGDLLRRAFEVQRPVIAVNYAGCMPYASKLPAIDMLGLNDSYIARHPPKNFGEGFIGHELGDGKYVLSRRPDLVTFCQPATGSSVPCFRSEVEMAQIPEFQKEYRLVLFESGNVQGKLWVRIEGSRIGITRSPDQIAIPGYLFASESGVHALLDNEGTLVAALEYGEAALTNIYIPRGKWVASINMRGDSAIRLDTDLTTGNASTRPSGLEVISSGEPRTLRLSGGPAVIYSVVLRRDE